jgi:hypothetical protein
MLKTPSGNQTGLKKLPKEVRNKMGYMYKGGMTKPKKTMKMNKGGYAKCGASYKGS